jgi:hypothetical protein
MQLLGQMGRFKWVDDVWERIEGHTFMDSSSRPGDLAIVSVAWGGDAFAIGGNHGRMAWSPDGKKWTPLRDGYQPFFLTGETVNCIAYGNGVWVAAGSGGLIAISPDD